MWDLPNVVEFTLVHQVGLVDIIQAVSFLLAGIIFDFSKHLLISNMRWDDELSNSYLAATAPYIFFQLLN
jgi:hypothetical protein